MREGGREGVMESGREGEESKRGEEEVQYIYMYIYYASRPGQSNSVVCSLPAPDIDPCFVLQRSSCRIQKCAYEIMKYGSMGVWMFEIVSPRQMTLRPVMPGGRSCAMRCGPTSGPWAAVR